MAKPPTEETAFAEVERFLDLARHYPPDMARGAAEGLHDALAEVARLEGSGADLEAIRQALADQLARRNKADAGGHQVKGWMLVTIRSMVRAWLTQGEHQERLRGYLDEIEGQVDRLTRLRAGHSAKH